MTDPPIKLSSRLQWVVIAGLVVWGLVVLFGGLAFVYALVVTTP